MAETIVNLVLGKLGDVLVKEVFHLYSVNEQVEKVGRELKRIQAFLKDVDRKPIKDERQKNWVKEVRDIAHSIEDVIDTFLMDIPQKSGIRATIKNMLRNPKNIPAVHNLVNEIKQIQEKMREIEESRVRYGIYNLGEGSTGDIKLPIRPTVLPDIDPDIVGFKADQDRIVRELLDETTKRRSVVSICGTGGLGKTTLARKVYNCNDVKRQFGICIWVAISETFEVIDVSKKISRQLNLEQPNEIEVILTEIHNSLRGKKYLIVLDDVWKIELWTQISEAFPDEKNGSRILVTTRFADVPKGMDPKSEPYMLQCLTEELSQELLLKTVFPNHDPKKSTFDDLSDIIGPFVHKCGGFPLALVVLGGFLSKKPHNHAVWSSVFRTMSWNVEGINCSEIIGTSYEDLPFALKSCFMYFSAFPEDYDIDAKSLLRMWIAEGFIPQEDNRSLEETAESFLEDLLQRSMIQVNSRSYVGAIQTLRIHDLLRDLALQKAKEENFLLVYSNPDDKLSLSGARRVAIHNPDCDQLIMSPNLRTLLCFHEAGSMLNCSKQRLLKVVSDGDEEGNIIELGMFVGLTQLRYLSFGGWVVDNRDQEFFEKVIGRMKFLQTLQVSRLRKIDGHRFKFPKSAWNIKTLRHVYDNVLELPASAKLTNLQTIGWVWATQSWEIELPHLPNLRSLQLDANPSPSKAVVPFLSTLEHLTDLEIWHDDSVLDILDVRGFPFYNHLQSLQLYYRSTTKLTQLLHEDMLPCHLIYLQIDGHMFQHDIMPVLEKLRCLKVLKLSSNAFESRKTTCSSGGFSQLEFLKLNSLSMEEWEIEEGALPILKKLEIWGCDELDVPQGLQYLTNLQKLEWWDVGDSSKANLVRNLCQHVPSIDLGRY
ncbi:disease resistance protein RPP13-like [Carex rostrata]